MNEQNINPTAIWLRDKQAVATYSISRTKLWMLAKSGKIRSVSLQEPGMTRATRLFCVKSIESYIESFLPENQAKEDSNSTSTERPSSC